ncbi:MAG: hypothetical protein AB1758_02525 [Candidatus Eremiobacterota bacterium]
MQTPILSAFCADVFQKVASGRIPAGEPDEMGFTAPAESLAISVFEGAARLVQSFDGHQLYDADERPGVVDLPGVEGGMAASAEGTRHDGEAAFVRDSERGGQATYVRIRPDSIDQVDVKGDLSGGPGARVIVTHVNRETGQGYYLRFSGQDWLVAG